MWSVSVDNLSAEVLEEFLGFASTIPFKEREGGYGLRRSDADKAAQSRAWRLANADLIASAEFRARAVENTRLWRLKQYADPELHEELKEKRRILGAIWRARHSATEKYKAATRRRTKKQTERLRLQALLAPELAAERRRLNNESARNKRYQLGGRPIVTHRTEFILAWAATAGEFTWPELQAAHGMSQTNAQQHLSRMTREGLLVRVSVGVYRLEVVK